MTPLVQVMNLIQSINSSTQLSFIVTAKPISQYEAAYGEEIMTNCQDRSSLAVLRRAK